MPRLAALLVADGADFVSRPVQAVDLVFGGIAGDLHAGLTRRADARTPWHRRGATIANTRQVSLVSLEELAAIAEALDLPAVDPALLGANLALEDAPSLSATPPGARLSFPSGATLFVTEANAPCRRPGRRLAAAHGRPELELRFVKAARGRRGIVAIVEREGPLALGDALSAIPPTRR